MSEAHAESHLPTYKKVILTLTAATVVEFGVSFGMHAWIPFVLGLLLLVGIAFYKAVLVARFFMHIKYDPSVLAFLCVLPLFLGTPIILLAGYDLVHGPNF